MVEDIAHPAGAGTLKFLGNPFKFENQQPLSYPPRHGADTRAVLESVCGYQPDRIESLISQGIVFQGENQ
jgi:CoA:oxalate CoA-transferase